MADDADRADRLVEQEIASQLSRIEVPNPDDGREWCEECGEQVEPARARLGYATCIDCQEMIERRRKGL